MNDIKYWQPIQSAWDKMVQVLFRPFSLEKWMVIGFSAFLANCGRQSGGGGSGGGGNGGSRSGRAAHQTEEAFEGIAGWFRDVWGEHATLIIVCGIMLVLLLFAIGILVNWLNSRGQFMLLDNVLKNRGAVREPWREYRREANSLMWFQILFDLIMMVVMLTALGGIILSVVAMISAKSLIVAGVFGVVLFFLLFAALALFNGFVRMVLHHFVVPLMYQRRLSIRAGFAAFSPVLKRHFWRIVLFGLVMILVNAAVGMALFLAIMLTCCAALFLLLIPYIGTVAVLPVYVFQRLIGVEFLRQFGDEYDLMSDFNRTPPALKPVENAVDPRPVADG